MGHLTSRLQQMFDEMVIAKDISRVEDFYHRDFWMSTNQVEQNLAEFIEDHRRYYSDPDLRYFVEFDDDSVVETPNGVSARLWITTGRSHTEMTRIEVLLIAKFVDDKIHRIWELTFPNWAHMKEFE